MSHPTEARFPRASRYHPEWVMAGMGSAVNALWLTEWLCERLDLRPGMRVLDLGCGRGISSIFLRREFGVQVWAADLWFHPTETLQRIQDAGVEDGVFPLRVDARSLPFAAEFFDAIVAIDSFMYFGTDDLFLPSLGKFIKPNGQLAIAMSGLTREIENEPPVHLREWWAQDSLWCFHSAEWWRRHWERTGIVAIEVADTMPDGWRYWLDSLRVVAPHNLQEIQAIEKDAGRNLGLIRIVGRRTANATSFDSAISIPPQYTKKPLLREHAE